MSLSSPGSGKEPPGDVPFKPDGPGYQLAIFFIIIVAVFHSSSVRQILLWCRHVRAPPIVNSAEPAIAKVEGPQTVRHRQKDNFDRLDVKLDSEPLRDAIPYDLLLSDDSTDTKPILNSPQSSLSLLSPESPNTANSADVDEQEERPMASVVTTESAESEERIDQEAEEPAYSLPLAARLELLNRSTPAQGQIYCTYALDPRRPECVLFKVGSKRRGLSMSAILQKQRKCGTLTPTLVGIWPPLVSVEATEEAMLQHCRRAAKAAQKAMKFECLQILASLFGNEVAERILEGLCQCGSHHVMVFPFPLTETLTINYWVRRIQEIFNHVMDAAMAIERAASASPSPEETA